MSNISYQFLNTVYAIIGGLFFAFVVVTPVYAASTHHYVCSDFFAGTASCTGNTITFNGSGQNKFDQGMAFNLYPTTIWYVTATVVPISGTGLYLCAGNINDCSVTNSFNSSLSDAVLDISSAAPSTQIGLWFTDDSSFIGTVSDICITDTLGGCVAPPDAPVTPCLEVFATSTCSFVLTDNPNLDFGMGMGLFTSWLFGIIWLFSKKR